MSKKAWTILIVALLVVLGVTVAIKDHHNNNPTSPVASVGPNGHEACDLFTLNDAEKIIGAAGSIGNANLGNHTTKDTAITTCPYSNASGNAAAGSTSQTITLLVHYGKTAAGKTANQKGYDAADTSGAVTVSGLGDKAFYDPSLGQLNVIKSNYWLTSSSSTIGGPQLTHDQVQAQQVAQDALTKI